MGLNAKRRRKVKWLLFLSITIAVSTVCQAQESPQKLLLAQAIQIAMSNSLERQMAGGHVKIARDKVAQARSAYGPKLTLDGGYYHYNDQPDMVKVTQAMVDLNNGLAQMGMSRYQEGPSDSLNYYGYQLQLTQPLYTGGKLTAVKKQAQANEQNSLANLVVTDNDLMRSVKKAYYTVLLCQQMGETMNQAVASMEKHLEEAHAYYTAKLVSKLDVLRAEEKLADLKQKQLLAQNNLVLAKTALNYVLGVDLDTNYVCSDTMQSDPFTVPLDVCKSKALERRPELKAINAQIEMAQQAVFIAKSDHKPTVALVANGHHYEPENASPSATVGVVATMKLFDSGMVKHQIAEAEDTLTQAQTGKEQLMRGIKLEVEQAFRNAAVALKTVEVAERSLDTAQETLQLTKTRYKVGLSTSLERLDAEVGLTQAQTNHTQALSMYNIALAELERAMGGKTEVN